MAAAASSRSPRPAGFGGDNVEVPKSPDALLAELDCGSAACRRIRGRDNQVRLAAGTGHDRASLAGGRGQKLVALIAPEFQTLDRQETPPFVEVPPTLVT